MKFNEFCEIVRQLNANKKQRTKSNRTECMWVGGWVSVKTFSFETDEITKINGVYIGCKTYFPDCGQATESSDII